MTRFQLKTVAIFSFVGFVCALVLLLGARWKNSQLDSDIVLIIIWIGFGVGAICAFDSRYDQRCSNRPLLRMVIGAFLFAMPHAAVFTLDWTVLIILAAIGSLIGLFGWSFFKHIN